MKRTAILILVLAGLLGSGAVAWHYADKHGTDTGMLTLYGNVDIRQVQLAFNASDRIVQMLASEGAHVNKGQLLATLDTTKLAHNVALQQAQLAAQKQVVARLEAGSRPEEIGKAQAEVEAARINAENAQGNYQRAQQLAAQHFISTQQVDDARAKADMVQAQYQAAQQTLKLVQDGPRKEDIAAARAQWRVSKAALDVAQKALADASLYAPDNGVIQERILEPGDIASPQRPVYTLALTDPLWVRVYVKENDLGKLKPGMSADVSTDSYPGKHYRAWVGYISPSAEFTPKAVETTEVRSSLVYQARVFVCDAQDELRLGMPATVTIDTGKNAVLPLDTGDDHCKQP